MTDDRMRLLICNTCKTIEPLPWFGGPPDDDATLTAALAPHRTAEGHPHTGSLATVSEKSWDDPVRRDKILEGLTR